MENEENSNVDDDDDDDDDDDSDKDFDENGDTSQMKAKGIMIRKLIKELQQHIPLG